MARMIPATLDPSIPSPGERDVFHRLASDPLSSGWTVIHSLDLPHHIRRISGELDFVVLVPEMGVLCLEIKAAATIARRDGVWYYGRDPKGDPRGPFRQASEGMHSLRERLRRRRPELSKVVFWSAVVLPYTSLNVAPEEWHPWQLIDSARYRSGSIAASCAKVLSCARDLLLSKESARWFDPSALTPSEEDCNEIVRLLRPNFEVYQSPRARRAQKSAELKRYTEEQCGALDAMARNPRVLFEGPAGTGKTLLAIECARRSNDAGKRTLFVCFNKLLATWIKRETQGLELVTAETMHAWMVSITGVTPPACPTPAYWREDLPDMALESLLAAEGSQPFDVLVVDEAQDLLDEHYLDVLDLSLSGGLATGEWRLFGDFERQAIYGGRTVALEAFRHGRGSDAPVYSLRANCRNTPRVAALVRLLSHLEPDYVRILRPDDGIDPDVRFYAGSDQAPRALMSALDEFRRDGYRGGDVTVLSPRATSSAAERIADQPWRNRLRPFGSAGDGHTPYGTIHAFKGLEAPAVIVTDIDAVSGDMAEALLYIAITRPTERLLLLLPESARSDIARLLRGPRTQGGSRACLTTLPAEQPSRGPSPRNWLVRAPAAGRSTVPAPSPSPIVNRPMAPGGN